MEEASLLTLPSGATAGTRASSSSPAPDPTAITEVSRNDESPSNQLGHLGASDSAGNGSSQQSPISPQGLELERSQRTAQPWRGASSGTVSSKGPHIATSQSMSDGDRTHPSEKERQHDRSMSLGQHARTKRVRLAEAGDQHVVSDRAQTLRALLERRRGELSDELRRAAERMGVDTQQYESMASPHESVKLTATGVSQSAGVASKTTAGPVGAHHRLHLGSAKPHELKETAALHARAARKAPNSSARNIESESIDVLMKEPIVIFNPQRFTEPEQPSSETAQHIPGPFSTKELIPEKAYEAVVNHRKTVVEKVLDRASRGPNAWRVAKNLRPEPLIMLEEEALNPCGRGHVWFQPDQAVDLWHALRTKRSEHGWPDRSLHSIDVDAFLERAQKEGLTDKRLLSWIKHDFPGPVSMPTNIVCIGSQHVGALKHVRVYKEINERDVQNKFVTSGRLFPEIWPTIVDYTNVVMQNGKGRITIDKSIRLSSLKHPEPLLAYNDYIDLEAERASGGDLELFSAIDFCRGATILMSACVNSLEAIVKFGKWDKGTFFRMHQKRLSAVPFSGRLNHDGYGHDWRVNFGERDAMDHCCAASDATSFFVRKELIRIENEYPIGDAAVAAWLLMRSACAPKGELSFDQRLQWAVTFIFAFFVDDANLLAIAVPLKRKDGTIVVELDEHGNERPVCRADFMLNASRGVALELKYDVPDKKFFPMALNLDCIGCGIDLFDGRDLSQARRYLPSEKRERYLKNLETTEAEASKLPNGLLAFERSDLNSIVHKLIHASATDVLGRPNLHYIRQALRDHDRWGNEIEREVVIMPKRAMREWCWWKSRLSEPIASLPLASRIEFPSCSAGTLIHYTDSSREEKSPEQSGLGGWTVICDDFLYVLDRWSGDEVAAFSINTMEGFAKDSISSRFLQAALERGLTIAHVQSYIDNSTAEMVAENGRTQSDAMAALQKRRIERNLQLGISETTERISSADNIVADLLSRGDLEDALRFAEQAKLKATRLFLTPEQRDTSWLPRTWA